jgi:hypothetical protein
MTKKQINLIGILCLVLFTVCTLMSCFTLCIPCAGSGNCQSCDGEGGTFDFSSGMQWVECDTCNGTGDCLSCGGLGFKF